jgi:hypothetical protein
VSSDEEAELPALPKQKWMTTPDAIKFGVIAVQLIVLALLGILWAVGVSFAPLAFSSFLWINLALWLLWGVYCWLR